MIGTGRKPRLSAPAIRRILAAADLGSSRPFLDVGALARCINVCADLYGDARSFNTQTVEKKHRGELIKALKGALQLKEQIASVSNRGFLPSLDQVLIHLSKLVEEMERVLELDSLFRPIPPKQAVSNQQLSNSRTTLEYDYLNGLAYGHHFKSKSPLQWLVGVYLLEVYQIFGGDRDKRYLAFAHQALKELKIKDGSSYYSREAIARAARGYSRKRKLAPRVDQDEWTFDRAMRFSWACGIHESLDLGTELRKREREIAEPTVKTGPKLF